MVIDPVFDVITVSPSVCVQVPGVLSSFPSPSFERISTIPLFQKTYEDLNPSSHSASRIVCLFWLSDS